MMYGNCRCLRQLQQVKIRSHRDQQLVKFCCLTYFFRLKFSLQELHISISIILDQGSLTIMSIQVTRVLSLFFFILVLLLFIVVVIIASVIGGEGGGGRNKRLLSCNSYFCLITLSCEIRIISVSVYFHHDARAPTRSLLITPKSLHVQILTFRNQTIWI